jgi:hypothetical protein
MLSYVFDKPKLNMATAEEYKQRISTFDKKALIELWQQIKDRNTSDWDAGKAFEYLVIRAFELEGARVSYPYSVKLDDNAIIEQIDGAVYFENFYCLIEAKDTDKPMNVEPVAKLRNQLLRRPSSLIGVVFSNSGFTSPAITLARFLSPQTILLWTGEELEYALENSLMKNGLTEKFFHCTENALPDYNLLEMEA